MTRDEFMDVVYDELYSDGDNNRANRIIYAADSYVDEYAPHWIPVTERLPKKCNTTYLATVDYGEHGMAVGQRFFFGDNIGWNDKSVVAWMPLPEPYKGVTE